MNKAPIAIRVLERLKLKSPVSRLLSRAPESVKRRLRIRYRERLVDPKALQDRFSRAISRLQSEGVEIGDYLEFGVYHGTSLSVMYRTLLALGRHQSRLIGFDSFEGLPPVASTDSGGHWQPGAFKSTLEFTRAVLDNEGVDWSRVSLVKGFFDETLTDERRAELGIRRASVIMIDCDLYQSTREALRFCAPAIVDKSVIFFDDWYPLADKGLGEKKAFDEFLAADGSLHAHELFDFPFCGKAFLLTRTIGLYATTFWGLLGCELAVI
jgi:O-methyltransferase